MAESALPYKQGVAQVATCRVCGSCKPHSEFYPSQVRKAGDLGECKECTRARVRENRQDNAEYYRSYDRLRYRTQEKRKEQARKCSAAVSMEYRVQKQRERREEDGRERANARQRARRAAKRGLIKQAAACFFCEREGNLHAHHPDYSKPLDVFWLCPSCHGKLHTVTGDLHRT